MAAQLSGRVVTPRAGAVVRSRRVLLGEVAPVYREGSPVPGVAQPQRREVKQRRPWLPMSRWPN
jgi:hypothetical protein